MARIREDIQLIENVAAGQTALIRPAIGRTWLEWHIEHTNVTLAQMTNIRVLLVSATKTVVLQHWKTGTELNEYNKRFKKRNVEAGTLSIFMRRPEMQTEDQRMATALGTGGLQALRIEVDIAPAATTASLKAWGKKTANRHVSTSLLTYIIGNNTGGNAEGENHWDSLNKRDRLAALHIINDKVSQVEMTVEDASVHKLSIARNNFDEKGGDRTPYATNYGYCLDFLVSGSLDEALVLNDGSYRAEQVRVTSTLAASPAATIRYIAEYLSSWASLAGVTA